MPNIDLSAAALIARRTIAEKATNDPNTVIAYIDEILVLRERVEQLEKEAEWLASQISLCPYANDCEREADCEDNCARTIEYWRGLARMS